MSRSIETPRDAIVACYRDIRELDQFDWDWFKEDIIETVKTLFPSMKEEPCLWPTNETRVLCSNELARITISTYAGLCCIALVPAEFDDYYSDEISKHNLALHWCNQVSNRFDEAFKQYKSIGTASNGETFYEKVRP